MNTNQLPTFSELYPLFSSLDVAFDYIATIDYLFYSTSVLNEDASVLCQQDADFRVTCAVTPASDSYVWRVSEFLNPSTGEIYVMVAVIDRRIPTFPLGMLRPVTGGE